MVNQVVLEYILSMSGGRWSSPCMLLDGKKKFRFCLVRWWGHKRKLIRRNEESIAWRLRNLNECRYHLHSKWWLCQGHHEGGREVDGYWIKRGWALPLVEYWGQSPWRCWMSPWTVHGRFYFSGSLVSILECSFDGKIKELVQDNVSIGNAKCTSDQWRLQYWRGRDEGTRPWGIGAFLTRAGDHIVLVKPCLIAKTAVVWGEYILKLYRSRRWVI